MSTKTKDNQPKEKARIVISSRALLAKCKLDSAYFVTQPRYDYKCTQKFRIVSNWVTKEEAEAALEKLKELNEPQD